MKRREVPRRHQLEGTPPYRHAARRVLAGLAVVLVFVVVTALRWEAASVADPGPRSDVEQHDRFGGHAETRVVVDRVVGRSHDVRPTQLAALAAPSPVGADLGPVVVGATTVDRRTSPDTGSQTSRAPPA